MRSVIFHDNIIAAFPRTEKFRPESVLTKNRDTLMVLGQSFDLEEKQERLVMAQRHRMPIIKVVGNACNLRCRYCFYSGMDQADGAVMDLGLLSDFIEQYVALYSGYLRFAWHGGEPLLAGIAFFEEAVRLQRRYAKPGDTVRNSIQTNGTLITDDWAAFFKENEFGVGVSIDGDALSHNRFRRDAGGKGTLNSVMRGLTTLGRHGIIPGAIQTLTRQSVAHVADDFRFMVDTLGIRKWSVNLYTAQSCPDRGMENDALTAIDAVDFYRTLIQAWLDYDDPTVCIREIDSVVGGVLGRRVRSCSFNGACGSFFCLDSDGTVYPCDRLSNDSQFTLGDLRKESLAAILSGSNAIAHRERARRMAGECQECRWRSICNNGCTAMRSENGGQYLFCDARKFAFEHITASLQRTGGISHE